MKISIIVPVYNGEEFFEECLDSLINQTHKDIEIVIVNDASTDNTKQIIKKYMGKDSRIVYVENKENMNLYETLCVGYENATGDYVTFCDADDYLSLNACEVLLAKAIETNADMVNSNMIPNLEGFNSIYNFRAMEIKGKEALRKWMNHESRTAKPGSLISMAIIHKFLEITPRNLKIAHAEDSLMFIQIHFLVQHKVHIEAETYAYRKNINSVSAKAAVSTCINRFHDYGMIVLYTKLFLEENNIYNDYKKEQEFTRNNHLGGALTSLYNISDTTTVVDTIQKLPSNIQKVYLEFLCNGQLVIIKNKWYNFGLMTNKQKIRHIIKYILRKLGLKFIYEK